MVCGVCFLEHLGSIGYQQGGWQIFCLGGRISLGDTLWRFEMWYHYVRCGSCERRKIIRLLKILTNQIFSWKHCWLEPFLLVSCLGSYIATLLKISHYHFYFVHNLLYFFLVTECSSSWAWSNHFICKFITNKKKKKKKIAGKYGQQLCFGIYG